MYIYFMLVNIINQLSVRQNQGRIFRELLTHISTLCSLWDIGKYNSPIWSYSVCLQECINKNTEIISLMERLKMKQVHLNDTVGKFAPYRWVKP